MKYSIQSALVALKHPEAIKKDFLVALAVAMETASLDLRVAKNFTGNGFASEQQLVTGNREITFLNMANGLEFFPEGEHMMMTRLRLYTGTEAALNKTVWSPGTEDPDLLNAVVSILSNGTRIEKDIPLATFTRAEEQPYSGYLDNFDPKFWFAQTPLEITIKAKVDIAAADLNLRWELSGPKLIA